MISMGDATKQALVDIHNQLRNEIAMGKLPQYASAANMATIEWDDALAAKAAIKARNCNDWGHDNRPGT